MRWAFIDYENIGTLKNIDLSGYDRVILLVGFKQPKVCFGDILYDNPINITFIKLADVQKNNLDFHLSYYLGKFDAEADKHIKFEVISNDNGFEPLVNFIASNGRKCAMRRTYTTVKCPIELFNSLSNIEPQHRPQRLSGLTNFITQKLKTHPGDTSRHIDQLIEDKIIVVSSEKRIKYTNRINQPVQ
jgi:hypothetical protein